MFWHHPTQVVWDCEQLMCESIPFCHFHHPIKQRSLWVESWPQFCALYARRGNKRKRRIKSQSTFSHSNYPERPFSINKTVFYALKLLCVSNARVSKCTKHFPNLAHHVVLSLSHSPSLSLPGSLSSPLAGAAKDIMVCHWFNVQQFTMSFTRCVCVCVCESVLNSYACHWCNSTCGAMSNTQTPPTLAHRRTPNADLRILDELARLALCNCWEITISHCTLHNATEYDRFWPKSAKVIE